MAKPVPRTIRLIEKPQNDGVGRFCISERKKETHYSFREIHCDIGGRGFIVQRQDAVETYHVRIGKPAECGCECRGFLRHGHCKHIVGLLALVENERM